MMTKFSDLSIRNKLTVLLGASAAIALCISSVMTIYFTFITQKNASLLHLRQIADISSENLTAALAFRDNASAAKTLGSLHTNSHILAAIIHDEEGQRFSKYISSATPSSKVEMYLSDMSNIMRTNHAQLFEYRHGIEAISFEYMFVIAPITFEGKTIGTLTIISDNQGLKNTITHYMTMQVLISLISLVVIVLISIRLQKAFTDPIFHMIAAIREISETKNYSVNVDSRQNDEFKVLYKHFNTMIAEVRERDEKLSKLATTDPLTGLANRRHAMDSMEIMVIRANRRHEPFGVVALDIDNFKRINDTLGHPIGDVVLKEVANILVRTAREYDVVARTGGEEFLILCDNSDLETTRIVAERARENVESAIIRYDEKNTLSVTISAGICSMVPVSDDIDEPLKIADLALYHAKKMGRNRVADGGSA